MLSRANACLLMLCRALGAAARVRWCMVRMSAQRLRTLVSWSVFQLLGGLHSSRWKPGVASALPSQDSWPSWAMRASGSRSPALGPRRRARLAVLDRRAAPVADAKLGERPEAVRR